MKKNFKWMAALAVAVAATSCSNDDLMTGLENNGAQTKGAIGVNTFVPTITRGAALNSVDDLIASENGFDLISFYNQPGDDGTDNYQLFMGTEDENGAVNDGIEFKHDDSAWDYADRGEIKFWQELPEEATDMKFFAVSPTISKWTDAGSYSITADEQTITYTVPTEVSEQVDIMYAQKDLAGSEYTNSSDAYTNGVPLNFHHALSQIVFKAKIADKEDTKDEEGNEGQDGIADYVTAHVNSITVKNVHGAGTFNMAQASSILGENEYLDGDLDGMGYDYNLWETSDDATNAYEVSTLQNASSITWTEALELTVGEVGGDETALMLLPQQLTGLDLEAIEGGNSANEDQFTNHLTDEGAYLKVSCRVEYKGDDDVTKYIVGEADSYANLYIPISTEWNPGYKYVYTLIFSADSGDPVKATVESVDEWNEYYEDVPETGEDNTGDGEEEEDESTAGEPYFTYNEEYQAFEISSANDLVVMRNFINEGVRYAWEDGELSYAKADYVLMENISLIGNNWYNSIATSEDRPFYGVFDGNGHTISDVSINQDWTEGEYDEYQNYGLFGNVEGGTIKNLTVEGTYEFSSTDTEVYPIGNVGGIVGNAYEATIENCHFKGEIEVGEFADHSMMEVGGIVGTIDDGEVIACSNSANLSKTDTKNGNVLGGVVGYLMDGTVMACYNTGTLTEKNYGLMGGVVGRFGNSQTGRIIGCYNNGTMTAMGQNQDNEEEYSVTGLICGSSFYASDETKEVAENKITGCYGKAQNDIPVYGLADDTTVTTTGCGTVDGNDATWSSVLSTMNSALTDGSCSWSYTEAGATETIPLVLTQNE